MDKIDVGSPVLCIEDKLSPLVQGQTYIVLEVTRGGRNIRVQGDSRFYLTDRFILKPMETKYYKGDAVSHKDYSPNIIFTVLADSEEGKKVSTLSNFPLMADANDLVLIKRGKQPLRWKLIRPEYMQAVREIAEKSPIMHIEFIQCVDTDAINRLKKAGVLELWFEPQYETEVKQVKAGDQGVTVEIKAGSSTITVIGMNGSFDIHQLRNVLSWASGEGSIYTLGSWNIRLKVSDTQRCFRLGCKDSAYYFSLWEMRHIKSEWEKLNPQ